MRITFLIGNGFDLNIGLNTSYPDFIAEYKRRTPPSDVIKKMHDHIDENRKLWSSAELALGQFTGEFNMGEGEAFSECHKDFCEQLAVYLKNQEGQIDYEHSAIKIRSAFSQLNDIINCFPSREKAVLDAVYKNHSLEAYVFQFICFNYTYTLDKCIDIVKKAPGCMGSHKYKGRVINHSVGPICHVHGTVDEEMVFAVDDESQIAKPNIFECQNGDLYRNFIIKSKADESFRENTDEVAQNILKQSQIIYIYGMSIGATDKSWWKRICDWLSAVDNRHLIIQMYEAPQKGVFPRDYQLYERAQRNNFLEYGDFEQDIKNKLQDRIHITGDNIFKSMAGIAEKCNKAVISNEKD